MLLVFLFLRLIHLHFQPLLAADEDSTGLGTLIGADDALLLHLIHDAGGAGITQLTAALQQAGGCLSVINDNFKSYIYILFLGFLEKPESQKNEKTDFFPCRAYI